MQNVDEPVALAFALNQGLAQLTGAAIGIQFEQIKGQIVDLIDLRCPEPLMMLRQAVRASAAGDILFVYATDSSTQRDFQRYLEFTGHQCLFSQEMSRADTDGSTVYAFVIKLV